VSSRSYLSIGDVLTLLRQEFPDVTISKIRFLESQGLVNPERTPSGYRKFYEHDVERLRWVLRQQREHFLPLKVIKDRLDEDGGATAATASAGADHPAPSAPVAHSPGPAPVAAAGEAPETIAEEAVVLVGPGATTVVADAAPGTASGLPGIETAARHRAPDRPTGGATATATPGSAAAAPTAPVERAHRASLATQSNPSSARTVDTPAANGTANRSPATGPTGHVAPAAPADPPAPKPQKSASRKVAASSATPGTSAAPGPASGDGKGDPPATAAGLGGASLSLEDLCTASGLSEDDVAQLQEYGLLSANVAAGVESFDDEALAVANLAGKFAAFGIEARHLRLYKNAADREAGFIEQIVIPMVRQRNPEARARATQTAEELSGLGQQLKASLLRTALRDIL